MLREEIAHALWKNEAKNGPPESVSNARTLEALPERVEEDWMAREGRLAQYGCEQPAPPTEPWNAPISEREDGVECLAFHRGKWVHVKWSTGHKGWSLGHGKAFILDGTDRPFAALPHVEL